MNFYFSRYLRDIKGCFLIGDRAADCSRDVNDYGFFDWLVVGVGVDFGVFFLVLRFWSYFVVAMLLTLYKLMNGSYIDFYYDGAIGVMFDDGYLEG